MSDITLGIVDDHNLFRKGLCELFLKQEGFSVILDAGDGKDLFSKIETVEAFPDVILLDLKMPKMNGIECLKKLNKQFPTHKTLVLSMYDDNAFIMKALKSGAKGYILKDADPKELFHAIRNIHETGLFVNQKLAETLIHNIKKEDPKSIFNAFEPLSLTTSDLEILSLVCQGLTNSEISNVVHRSSRTVEGYRQKLLDKTNTKNTASLVAWAFRKGLVD